MSKLFTHATYALFIWLGLSLTTITEATAIENQCKDLFSKSGPTKNPIVKFESVNVEVEGVKVTGDGIKNLRANLDLTDALLTHLKENKLSVLSLGEGYSELLPFLIEKGISTKGLDPWYHSTNFKNEKSPIAIRMQKFQDLYAAHLIRGSALAIPLKAESIDFIFSHRLLSSLHIAEQLKAITETIRVLKISGEAHLLLNESRITHPHNEFIFKTILDFIKENYAGTVSAQIVNGLLLIDKLAKTSNQEVIPFEASNFYDGLPTGSRGRNDREDARLLIDYESTEQRLAKDPENKNLLVELYAIKSKLSSFRKTELTEEDSLSRWWNDFTSRFSIRPEIRE